MDIIELAKAKAWKEKIDAENKKKADEQKAIAVKQQASVDTTNYKSENEKLLSSLAKKQF